MGVPAHCHRVIPPGKVESLTFWSVAMALAARPQRMTTIVPRGIRSNNFLATSEGSRTQPCDAG